MGISCDGYFVLSATPRNSDDSEGLTVGRCWWWWWLEVCDEGQEVGWRKGLYQHVAYDACVARRLSAGVEGAKCPFALVLVGFLAPRPTP